MISGPLVIGISFAYLALLFAVAYWADRRAEQGRSVIAHPTVYALSLAVYCTAWTFYGSVGRATENGLGFLPIYLGPTLIALLWGSLLLKMVRVSKTERITSIADFIASRYGKSQMLGGLVTIIAVIGVVPYIALQLKAIAWSFTILQHYPEVRMPVHGDRPFWGDTAFIVALLLAAFTILFGTRHLDASERHEGMVAAIAFESIVKLLAFLAMGLFVTFGLLGWGGPELPPIKDSAVLQPLLEPSIAPFADWFAISLLAGLAVMLLPRQFQVAVVENSDERHLRRALWLFPLYLLLINLFVVPIAIAGLLTFPDGTVNADTFMLTLPIVFEQPWLALFVYIGGISAATGMVIVETIALSTMVSNDLVLPALLRRWRRRPPAADLGRLLLTIRRGAIVVILLLGLSLLLAGGRGLCPGQHRAHQLRRRRPVRPRRHRRTLLARRDARGRSRGVAGRLPGLDLYPAPALLRQVRLASKCLHGLRPLGSRYPGADGTLRPDRLERDHPWTLLEPHRQYPGLPLGFLVSRTQRSRGIQAGIFVDASRRLRSRARHSGAGAPRSRSS
jgi:Na+/proline symporter